MNISLHKSNSKLVVWFVVATCRSPVSEAWYLFDDHLVSEVRPETVVTKDAYILFYQRRCERNAAATVHLRSFVAAPSGDTSLTSLVNSSIDNTLCGKLMQLPR